MVAGQGARGRPPVTKSELKGGFSRFVVQGSRRPGITSRDTPQADSSEKTSGVEADPDWKFASEKDLRVGWDYAPLQVTAPQGVQARRVFGSPGLGSRRDGGSRIGQGCARGRGWPETWTVMCREFGASQAHVGRVGLRVGKSGAGQRAFGPADRNQAAFGPNGSTDRIALGCDEPLICEPSGPRIIGLEHTWERRTSGSGQPSGSTIHGLDCFRVAQTSESR